MTRAWPLVFVELFFGCATTPQVVAPAPSPVVAKYGERQIRQAEVDAKAADELQKLLTQVYELRIETAEQLALEVLVAAEAKKDGASEDEWLERQVARLATPATNEQLLVLFAKAKGRLPENVGFEEVKGQLTQVVERENRGKAARQVFDRLKRAAGFEVVLVGPAPLRKVVEVVGPVRGEASAPVTIVVFADFECPYCSRAAQTVEQVRAAYAGKVRVVFRHFPLSFHPKASKAAEAAACADEQGQFWAFHDALFEGQELELEAMKASALRLGLDAKRFDACLDSGRMAAVVLRDQAAGGKLGVSGTPAFFINGVMLSGAQPEEAFRRIIDDELKAK